MRSRDSGNSDEFIREVDEAVRQDRWLAVWKQYNAYIIGAALAVVIGTGAGVGWQAYQDNQRSANARELADATALFAEDKPAEAAAAFNALAARAGGGVAVVARLQAAEAEKQAGDGEAKLALLDSLAGDSDVAPLYQRLAALLATQESFNDSDTDALIGELERAATPDNPWRASLIELKAIAEMKAGRTDEARATLGTLLDVEAAPASLRRRANELLSALGGPLDGDNQAVSQNSTDDTDDTEPALDAAADGEAAQ
ncbi:MAG: tetratricopeptide repeat protein [Geminicoccaceae bacterium]